MSAPIILYLSVMDAFNGPPAPEVDLDSWSRIKVLFDCALEQPAEQREQFLAESCPDNNLRSQVRHLLQSHARATGFLEVPAMSVEPLTAPFEPGELLASRFRITRFLGQGGMGDVFEAEDQLLSEKVAIKTIKLEIAGDMHLNARLRRELQLARQISHPNVCRLFELWEHRLQNGHNIAFLTMELLQGETLADRIADRGPMSRDEALPLIRQAAVGLAEVHRLGILHGDLKPSNLFLCPASGGGTRVVVTDFGLARLADRTPHEWTSRDHRLGTPAYMAPELFYSGELTFAADIYSFGITILEVTTGCREPVLASRKMPAGLGPAWNAVLKKCLDPDPEHRFASAMNVIENLENPEAWWQNDWQMFPGKGRRRWVLICAFFALIAILFLAEWPRLRQLDTHPAPSIAVLPFTNLSGVSKDQYLADGLPEELASKLTKMEGLRVAAPSSTLRFRGATDLRETAGKLHVRMLLTGSVRVSGDQIRVTAALVRAGDETQIWSEIYERPLKDTFGVQEQIATAVANALRVKLAKGIEGSSAPVNPDSYNFYLQGRFYSTRTSTPSLEKAIAYYQRALDLDPNYAAAYAALAIADANLSVIDVPRPELGEQARNAANRALALNNRLADAHIALGFVMQSFDFRWREAEEEFQTAIRFNPADVDGRYYYAGLLMNLLRTKEARVQLQEARRLDSLPPRVLQFMALLLMIEGRNDEAEIEVRKLIASAPELVNGHTLLGLVLMRRSRREEGLVGLRRALDISKSPYVNARLGWALGTAGHTAEAEQTLAQLSRQKVLGDASPVQLAAVYGGLGRLDEGFDALRDAVRNHDPGLVQIQIAPIFDSFKNDQRFRQILNSMGMRTH